MPASIAPMATSRPRAIAQASSASTGASRPRMMIGLPRRMRVAASSVMSTRGRHSRAAPVSITRLSIAVKFGASPSAPVRAVSSCSTVTKSSGVKGSTSVRRKVAIWPKQPRSRPISRANERTYVPLPHSISNSVRSPECSTRSNLPISTSRAGISTVSPPRARS